MLTSRVDACLDEATHTQSLVLKQVAHRHIAIQELRKSLYAQNGGVIGEVLMDEWAEE